MTTTGLGGQNRPPPYSNSNAFLTNQSSPRSRSKAKRSSQVRLRPNAIQRRPVYSRTPSQQQNNIPQSDSPV